MQQYEKRLCNKPVNISRIEFHKFDKLRIVILI